METPCVLLGGRVWAVDVDVSMSVCAHQSPDAIIGPMLTDLQLGSGEILRRWYDVFAFAGEWIPRCTSTGGNPSLTNGWTGDLFAWLHAARDHRLSARANKCRDLSRRKALRVACWCPPGGQPASVSRAWMTGEMTRAIPRGDGSAHGWVLFEAHSCKPTGSCSFRVLDLRKRARCIDHSDPAHPVLWFISPNAWYKVAGAAWWDFVAPHPLYARIFEPARRGFAAACLVARCLQSRYLNFLMTDLSRPDRFP